MTDKERNQLAAKAESILNEIQSKLDISGYYFCDGSGEPTAHQLQDLARQCSVARLGFAARMLVHTAKQVIERSETW